MRWLSATLAIIILLPQSFADECPPATQAFLNKCYQFRVACIEDYERVLPSKIDELRKAKTARINKSEKPGFFPTQEAKDSRISELRNEIITTYTRLLEAREGNDPIVPLLDARLNLDDIGVIADEMEIDQVVDKLNVRVTCELTDAASGRRIPQTFWLKGFSTANLADGETHAAPREVVRVTGNKTYTTVIGGTNTVMVVEKYNLDAARRFFEIVPLPEFDKRNWSDADDKFLVRATVVGLKDGKVGLQIGPDSETLWFAPSKLSKTDQAYVKKEVHGRFAIRNAISREFPDAWSSINVRLKQLAQSPEPRQSQQAEKTERPGSDVAADSDKKLEQRWVNESYSTILRHVKDKDWAEFEKSTGRVHLKYIEVARTNEYLEVFCPARSQQLRFYAKRAELMKDGNWGWVANGHWEDSTPQTQLEK